MQSEPKSDPINRGYKNNIHNKVEMQIKRISWIMQLSQLLRFDHGWYRCLNRGPIGTIVSNLSRSHYILIIELIVENNLAAKIFSTFTTIGRTIVTIAKDRMTSQQIVTNPISSCS